MEENEAKEAESQELRLHIDSSQAEAFGSKLGSTTSEIALANTTIVATLESQLNNGTIRTLDGELAGDEMEQDAINYQILLGKIDKLLERLRLDA